MANTTVYPYGTNGSLPSSIGIINDPYTGGADKAFSAEQGKVLNEKIYDYSPVDLSSISADQAFISASTDKWVTTSSSYKCKFYGRATPGKTFLVKGNAERRSYVALLKNNTYSSGGTPSYADGCSLVSINAGDYVLISVPHDGAYMYVATLNNGNNCTPASINEVTEKIQSVSNEIDIINSQAIDTISATQLDGWVIGSDSKWRNAGTGYASSLVTITPGEKYLVVGNNTGGVFTLLNSSNHSSGSTPSWCSGYDARRRVEKGACFSFIAPEDAAYVYLAIESSGASYDLYVAIPKSIQEQMEEGGGDGKDGFNTPPEYFAWKKAEQMLNFKWTPLKAVPKSTTGNFSANTEQTGTPYSSVAEYDKRLGEDVSFYTFMTALHNKYSLVYTENVRYSTSQSAYGIQYYGASNCAMYYGVVCSGFTSYALGTIPYVTGQFDDLAEEGIFDVVYDQSANGVKRGDVLWQEGHVLFVQDVWRKNGVVTKVVVTEQWQPLARVRGTYSASQFNSFLRSEGIIIYRYKELYKNIHYEQSPFVTVGDETPLPAITYNDDICTFAGDMAAFAEGDLIYIHCLNLDYPQMELYKGDTLIDTITLASDSRSSLTSDELAYAVNLSNDELTYGKYKARLKSGSAYSNYTYFEIINATVTVSGDIATYSSANATAEFWYWQKYHTTDGGKIHNMTALDGKKSGTMDVSNRRSGFPMLKVLFRGDYGRVAARFLEE